MGQWMTTTDGRHPAGLVEILGRMRNFDTGDPSARYVSCELGAIADRAEIDREDVHDLWRSLMETSALSVLRGTGLHEPVDPDVARAMGERLAADGRSLTESFDMVMALRRLAMEAFRRAAQGNGHEAGAIAVGMAHLSRSSTQFMLEVNRGHLEAEVASRARRRLEQDTFIWQLLTGTSPGGDDFIQLDSYGLDGMAHYHAFRARPATDRESALLDAHLCLETTDKRKIGMAMTIDRDVCGLMTELPPPHTPVLVGVSDAVPFTDLPNAFRRATRAFTVAQRIGLTGLQSLESLGVIASVVADKEIAAVLDETYLAPMQRLGEYGATLLDTVRSYTSNACQLDTTAEELMLHVNTVRYRIAKFEEILGVSMRDTRVLAEVWWALNLPVDWAATQIESTPAGGFEDILGGPPPS
jgi:hypothetical protein